MNTHYDLSTMDLLQDVPVQPADCEDNRYHLPVGGGAFLRTTGIAASRGTCAGVLVCGMSYRRCVGKCKQGVVSRAEWAHRILLLGSYLAS
jgi:hypothetical protein